MTLFYWSGFEQGDFSRFDFTGQSAGCLVQVVNAPVLEGAFAGSFFIDGDAAWDGATANLVLASAARGFGPQPLVYARCHFRFDALPPVNFRSGEVMFMAHCDPLDPPYPPAAAAIIGGVSIDHDPVLGLRLLLRGTPGLQFSNPIAFAVDTWYCLLLGMNIAPVASGWAQVLLDGNLEINFAGATDAQGLIDQVAVGCAHGYCGLGNWGNHTAIIDAVVMADSPIDCLHPIHPQAAVRKAL